MMSDESSASRANVTNARQDAAGVRPDGGGRGQHERANRAHWDRNSDRYQAGHGVWLAATPDAWGAWRVPEAALRLLPDVAGKDVLELGCGAGQ